MTLIRINNVFSKIEGDLSDEILTELDQLMSYEVEGSYFMSQNLNYHWDGRKHLFRKASKMFPTGLFSYCREVLNKFQVPFKCIDERKPITQGLPIPLQGVTLYDYQEEITKVAIQKQRGIVQAATGSGKTECISDIIGKLNVPSLVLTHRGVLLHQTRERLHKRLKKPIGIIGDNECIIQKFNVGTVQTLKNKKFIPFLEKVECLIIDECHHAPSALFGDASQKCNNALYRLGFSASPWREAHDEMLMEAALGKKIVDIKASDLIKRGLLAKPYFFILPIPRMKNIEQLSYPKVYELAVVNNDYRNNLIVQAASILCSQMKRTTLIAVTRINHGQLLLDKIRSEHPELRSAFIQGENDSDEKKQALIDLQNHILDVVIATTVFGEGVDCPSLGALICAKGQDSSVDAFQLAGRAIRKSPGKESAIIIDFADQTKYLKKHSKSREKIYSSESLFDIKHIEKISDLMKVEDTLFERGQLCLSLT